MSNKISVNDASVLLDLSKQAIIIAVQKRKIEGVKISGHWLLDRDSVRNYPNIRYNALYRSRDGYKIYSPIEGRYSVRMLSKYLGIKEQAIYYQIKCGRIPFTRIGASIVIHCVDKDDFISTHFPHKRKKSHRSKKIVYNQSHN